MASNLTEATREMVDKTWRSAVSYGSPLFTRLIERKQVIEGGLKFQQLLETSDMQSLVQEYGPNDGLVGGSKEFIDKPEFVRAFIQVPLEKSVDESVMNAPKGDHQLLNIAKKNTQRGIKGVKLQMMHRMYGCATDTEIDAYHTYMQGLPSALLENTTYGSIARSGTTTGGFWQSADYSAWDTAVNINKYNVNTWLDSCLEYSEDRGEFLIVMGNTLYNRLKGIFEASNTYTPKANKSEQGFESMEFDGIEIAKCYLLDRMVSTGSTNNQGSVSILHNGSKTINSDIGATTSAGLCGNSSYDGNQYVFVLDLRTWNLRYSFNPDDSGKRAGDSPFIITDYFDQSQLEGGVEKALARVKFRGNLCCDLPNHNLMRANVS